MGTLSPCLPLHRVLPVSQGTARLGSTFRKVNAVHFSSSVPSGDSMSPTKQAFQISSMKSGEGMRCRVHRQNSPSANKATPQKCR